MSNQNCVYSSFDSICIKLPTSDQMSPDNMNNDQYIPLLLPASAKALKTSHPQLVLINFSADIFRLILETYNKFKEREKRKRKSTPKNARHGLVINPVPLLVHLLS
jgi:hypothetical protein